jgi:hypothetical protein
MERQGGYPKHGDIRRRHRLAIILSTLALVAAACSGGDASDSGGSDETDGVVDDGGSLDTTTTSIDALLELVDPTGDSLFACSTGAGSDASVAYLQADATGLNAEWMRAVVGEYNRRCGTTIDVDLALIGSGQPGCDELVDAAATITVSDHPSPSTVECFADSGLPLWSEAGIGSVTLDEAEGFLVTTDAPPDLMAQLQVRLLDAEQLLGSRATSIVYLDTPEAALIARDGFAAGLEDAGVVVSEVAVDATCNSAAAQAAWTSAIVITVVPAACHLELARAATSAGASPQWVVFDYRASIADDADVDFASVAPIFDVALAYSASPVIGAGWPRVADPHARDAAGVAYLDDLLGTSTAYPSVSWHEAARFCSTAHALLQLLVVAGPGATTDDLADALASVDSVPYPRGQIGGFAPGKDWVGPAQLFSLEWSADCDCWTHVAGPLRAG